MNDRFFLIGVVLFGFVGCSATGPGLVFDDITDYEPGTVISAMPVETHPPGYPRQALLDCVGGLVEMVITVDADGKPQEIDVMHAEPGDVFVRSASAAVFKWRFKAPVNEGVPVPSRQRLPIEFNKPERCYR